MMTPEIQKVLDYVYSDWELGECSIRYYLVELAKQVWIDEEGFSGKRPFGNSGWKTDVCWALAEGGFIHGERNEDGGWEWHSLDRVTADRIIQQCILAIQND